VVVEEIEIPVNYTSTTYKSRNQSNTPEDTDGEVIIASQQNATVKVTNTYLPNPTTVDLDIKGTKDFDVELPISAQNAGTFTFVVERWDGSAWVETKRTSLTYAAGEGSSDKTFTFDNVLEGVTFEKIGTYNYQVRELIGTVANVTYDRTLYTFTVTVTDNKGQLEATVTDLNNETITDGSYEVIFTNTYHTAPVSIDITKTVNNLSGSPAVSKAGFKFVVQTAKVDAEGNWSVKTAEEGGRTFSVISDGVGEARMMDVYTQPGTYRYILTEEKTAMSGWVFSEAKYYVAVVVTADDENTGALTAVVTVETD
jgi:pilin isopeptide linkage protein